MNHTLLLGLIILVVFWLGSGSKSGPGRASGRPVGRASGAVDTRSERWGTSVHEAGHYRVAKQLGGRGVHGWLLPDGGEVYGRLNDGVDSAIVALAGRAAGRRISGRYGHSGHDERVARQMLRGTGVSYSQARREAERLVSTNWGAVKSDARRLYRNGRI